MALTNLRSSIATMRDERVSGTNDGASTTTYTARVLNTLIDPDGLIQNATAFTGTAGTNTLFILNAGTYRIDASAPNSGINTTFPAGHKAKLFNLTDSVDVIIGSTEDLQTGSGTQFTTRSVIKGTFTITKQTTFSILHKSFVVSPTGFGISSTFGDNEIYTLVEIQKLST
jgi:hypothetical protein